GNSNMIGILLDHVGPGINLRDSNGDTRLHYAARAGQTDIAAGLVMSPSIDPDMMNSNYATPLLFACSGGYVDIVRLLLARDDVDALSVCGPDKDETPISAAIYGGHTVVVDALIKHHLTIGSFENTYETPLSIARKMDHRNVVKLL
ncbi:ankyrin, partial [Patellaria atrata CBS 101060]